jgi:hypothetical protein
MSWNKALKSEMTEIKERKRKEKDKAGMTEVTCYS